jgi:hypothetical protein
MQLMMRSILTGLAIACCILSGCFRKPPQYGTEWQLSLPSRRAQVWAVAPAVNLSGHKEVDPLLHADALFGQLQHVEGLTVIPVNRVVEVYASLGIDKVESQDQAALVCDMLGCDALVVPTVTAYDPYNPPKLGAALQLFGRNGYLSHGDEHVNPRELARRAAPPPGEPLPSTARFLQSAGMYDAANGSVRDALLRYSQGRNDPVGPLQAKEYFVSMDRYTGFVYHELIQDLLLQVPMKRS